MLLCIQIQTLPPSMDPKFVEQPIRNHMGTLPYKTFQYKLEVDPITL